VATVLAEGGVAVIPTDTCYGLAANAIDDDSVRRVFAVKRRSLDKPVSIFLESVESVGSLFETRGIVKRALRLLPGRVTLILEPKTAFPRGIAGPEGVGVRVSPHPLPRLIARLLGGPITATSANISGRPSPYSVEEAGLDDVDAIVDAGPLPRIPVSTVVKAAGDRIQILREGAIPSWVVRRIVGLS